MNNLEVEKEIKSRQIEKLYVVLEDKMGINVDNEYDQIGIRRAEALGIERERLATESASTTSKDKDKIDNVPNITLFNLIGEPVTVQYSEEETKRLAEIKCHQMSSRTSTTIKEVMRMTMTMIKVIVEW
ncbi:hypothetical protein Hanom_Chr13g01201231 [Helianthus anomalus]